MGVRHGLTATVLLSFSSVLPGIPSYIHLLNSRLKRAYCVAVTKLELVYRALGSRAQGVYAGSTDLHKINHKDFLCPVPSIVCSMWCGRVPLNFWLFESDGVCG